MQPRKLSWVRLPSAVCVGGCCLWGCVLKGVLGRRAGISEVLLQFPFVSSLSPGLVEEPNADWFHLWVKFRGPLLPGLSRSSSAVLPASQSEK